MSTNTYDDWLMRLPLLKRRRCYLLPMRRTRNRNAIRAEAARISASAKNALREMVEVVGPGPAIMGLIIHVPDVRNLILLQVTFHSLADADQAVFVSACQPEQL